MKKKEKINDTSTFNKKKSMDKNVKKIDLPPTDKEAKPSNLLNIIPDKKGIKTKIVKIPNKKYNSLKNEKTPEKNLAELSKYDKISTNIKPSKKESNIILNNTKNSNNVIPPSNNQVSNSAITNNKFKQISPKVELILSTSKIDQKKNQETISGADKSTLVPLTSETIETSIYHPSTSIFPNPIYTNYNKNISKGGPFNHKNSNSIYTNVSLNQSKIKTSFSVEYTYKIIDLMEKMKNFLLISSQNQALFFSKQDNNFGDLGFGIDIPFPTIGGKHMKKNLSEDFDLLTNKLYLELNKNNDFLRNNKINRFYKEIEGIFKTSSDLNESIKTNIFNTFENTNESIRFESTRVNIESIIQTSDRMENLYHKLFNICKDCLTEIKSLIFESLEESKIENKSNYNSNQDNNPSINKQNNEELLKNRNDEVNIENIIKNNVLKNKNVQNRANNEININISKENIDKTKIDSKNLLTEEKVKTEKTVKKRLEIKPVDKTKSENIFDKKAKLDDRDKSDDKNKMINEKLEMLKHLKEKKEQILNQKTVRFDENTKIINKTGRIGNNTEIDPSELNENVLTIKIPQSNICEVNKPVTDNNNFKLYTSEGDDNTFQGDSEIILHFDKLNLEGEENEKDILNNSLENSIEELKEIDPNLEKTLNDTVIETGNSFMKNHKRSKSHTIQKQMFSYAIKPQEIMDKNFINAKFDLKEITKNDANNPSSNEEKNKETEKNVKNNNNSKCIIY